MRSALVMALCTFAGLSLTARIRARASALRAWLDALCHMRALLSQERMPLDELISTLPRALPIGSPVGRRLSDTGARLRQSPSLTVYDAYIAACATAPILSEGAREREALDSLFRLLGSGSLLSREQALDSCVRHIKRIEQEASEAARRASSLYLRLGALCGIALGIAVL